MRREGRPYTVALTGGVASGKSAAAAVFAALGVPVVDTDQLAREVVAIGSEGLAEIVAAFGPGVLADDGSLDRRALRHRVFADPAARMRLEAITHPRIRALAEARVTALTDAPYALLAIPLLRDRSLYPFVDRVLLIDAAPEVQIIRVMARDGVDAAHASAMLAAQPSREQRRTLADDVIDNDGSREALAAAVRAIDRRYRSRAGH